MRCAEHSVWAGFSNFTSLGRALDCQELSRYGIEDEPWWRGCYLAAWRVEGWSRHRFRE